MKNIEILNEESGAPRVTVHSLKKAIDVQVSISHIDEYAIAMAIVRVG